MVHFVGIVVLIAGALYFAVNAGLAIGVWRQRRSGTASTPHVSVIVAARNEERSLPLLLERLSRQSYPSYEVILVNDRSTDRTREILAEASQRSSVIRGIDAGPNPDGMPAKKNALRTGIEASKGEILCFTDADCEPGTRWVETLVAAFDDATGMVAGFSPYRELPLGSRTQSFSIFQRLLYRFVAYEEFRAALWSAGSIGWDHAWLCTGRNLAYRKAVYQDVGGFEPIRMSVSGDDDLFMLAVRRKTQWGIRYCYDPQNSVSTDPPLDFRQFVNQRKRHFSAAGFFPWQMKLFLGAYHASNLILVAAVLSYFIVPASPSSLLPALGIKLAADTGLVLAGSEALRVSPIGPRFIVMEILYVFYNAFIGPLGLFFSFTWKSSER